MLEDLIYAYIESKCGTMVAAQYENTHIEGEDFEKQNRNALKLIKQCFDRIIHDDYTFTEEAIEDMQEYLDDLNQYLES